MDVLSEREVAIGLQNLVADDTDGFLEMTDTWVDDVELSVKSFADAGVMSNNAGFVLTVGVAQYQVTVVRSK